MADIDRPAHPLDEMHYLDGYLSYHHDDADLPDGAWFQIQVDMIAEHWPEEKDAHECFMQYLEWKSAEQEKEKKK